jgi:hypothetical protein
MLKKFLQLLIGYQINPYMILYYKKIYHTHFLYTPMFLNHFFFNSGYNRYNYKDVKNNKMVRFYK